MLADVLGLIIKMRMGQPQGHARIWSRLLPVCGLSAVYLSSGSP
jgi:hypothetical protein